MVTRRWTCLLPSERVAAAKRFWVAASSVIKWVGEFARRAAGRRVRSAVTSPTSCRGQSRLAAGARCHFTLRGLVAELAERGGKVRSEEHTSELQSLMRTSYAVF